MTSQHVRRDTPWTAVGGGTSLWPSAFGALLLCWSWWEASGSASLDDQTGWLVTAILGVGAAGLGLVAWLRAGRRAVARRRLDLIAGLEDVVSLQAPRYKADVVELDGFITYAGSTRYHRAGCLLTEGKGAYPVRDGQLGSSQACELCQP